MNVSNQPSARRASGRERGRIQTKVLRKSRWAADYRLAATHSTRAAYE